MRPASTTRARLQLAALAAAVLVAWLGCGPALADSVTLTLTHTGTPAEAQLDWAGGLAPFQVYRSSAPSSLGAIANLYRQTNVPSVRDAGAPAGNTAFYYLVLEGHCGDAVVDLNEDCDGTNLGGQTCQTLGYTSGPLLCTSGCAYDTTQCVSSSTLPLDLSRSGVGLITVNGAASCAGTCSQTTQHATGSMVTLIAAPQNASDHYFGGWGGDCSASGISRTCVVSMTQARSVTAAFTPITANLAFVSSAAFPPNRSGAAPYDQSCNQLATAAGLNNATGTAWVSWISEAGSTPFDRMPSGTRGWIRLDGKPIADEQVSLTQDNTIFYPIRFDETGQDAGSVLVMTGTGPTGVQAFTCNNWNGGAGFFTFGFSGFGPGGWTQFGQAGCNVSGRIYCMMATKSVFVSPVPAPGKRVYLSEPFAPSIFATPDQQCTTDRPIGMGAVKALVATTTSAASTILNPAQLYVRLDGVPVGTGADLIAQVKIDSGIWQNGVANYVTGPYAWTGHFDLTTLPPSNTTCSNWRTFASDGGVGYSSATNALWFNGGTLPCNTTFVRLYCVEQ